MGLLRSFRDLDVYRLASDCEYIDAKRHSQFDTAWQRVGAMLNGMIDKAEFFCQPNATRSRRK
jgi:hypothetical protein